MPIIISGYRDEMTRVVVFFFFFNDTATTEIYTLSLHDALPIFVGHHLGVDRRLDADGGCAHLTSCFHSIEFTAMSGKSLPRRSEEHTSELQSRQYLVCRLLLEKKKKK